MRDIENSNIPKEAMARHHEQRDLSVRMLFGSLAILAVLTAGAVALMAALFGVLENREAAREPAPSALVERNVVPPQPRLEVQSGELLGRLRAIEDVQLSSYSWVDQETGVARIPVRRAMEILAERGMSARASVATVPPQEQK